MWDNRPTWFTFVVIGLAIWIGTAVVQGITYALDHAAGAASQLIVSRQGPSGSSPYSRRTYEIPIRVAVAAYRFPMKLGR
jgi:hypothetical protein